MKLITFWNVVNYEICVNRDFKSIAFKHYGEEANAERHHPNPYRESNFLLRQRVC